jgi:DNA-binding MarR family transcriptional regulator
MPRVKPASSRATSVPDHQAHAFQEIVTALLVRFKLMPGMLAGSPYADLHVNDIGLLVELAGPGEWNVRRIAETLGAPVSTISSALDRLEKRGLIARARRPGDRRAVYIEPTATGRRLIAKLLADQVEACRAMLSPLNPDEREELIRLTALMAQG